MATHRRTQHRPSEVRLAATVSSSWAGQLERWAVALTLTTLIARPLFPSEDAETGSGLLPVALLGLAAVLWAGSHLARGRLWLVASWIDLLPLALLALIALAALRSDTQRPAINMACEWAGLIITYYMTRQLFRGANHRLIVSAMLALAVTVAIHGVYQFFWGFESLRQEFAANRLTILRQWGIAPGSVQEESLRNRLNSHEPFATFALANSLAGFLIVWVPVLVHWWLGVLMGEGRSIGWKGRVHIAASSLCVLATIVCILFTQSRTAYIGLTVQFVCLFILYGRMLWNHLTLEVGRNGALLGVAATTAIVVGLIAAAWHRGKLDEALFTQAVRSLSFRWEYWRATVRVIGDRPWLGVGPGGFRDHYLQYKLAESSEEIADPHNFVLELAATSGVAAGLLAVAWLGCAAAIMLCRAGPPENAKPLGAPLGLALLLGAGAAGFITAATISGLDFTIYLSLFVVWCLTLAVVAAGKYSIDRRVAAVATLGLAIHLLGAGGIAMPGVVQSLWCLMALGLNAADGDRPPRRLAGTTAAATVALVAIALWIALLVLVVHPVTGSTAAVTAGRNLFDAGDAGGAEAKYRLAVARDRLSFEPWLDLSRIHSERWWRGRGPVADRQFVEAILALENARRVAPSRLEPIRRMAQLYEIRAERDEEYWEKAADLYAECVSRYPNHAGLNARLARALGKSGQMVPARQAARRALELDAQTPHQDHKLTASERAMIQPLQHHPAPVE